MKSGARKTVLVIFAGLVAASVTIPGCIVVVRDRDSSDVRYTSNSRKRIGVELESVSRALATQAGVDARNTALVTRVLAGSPAEEAGIERYDIITNVNGAESGNERTLRRAIEDTPEGQPITVTVRRAGETLELTPTVQRQESSAWYQ